MNISVEDVRRALHDDQMVPSFQPLVGLHTGRLTGFELLARWQHPEKGPVLPPDFIRLAEENGLIEHLMEQVFQKAFAAASLLPAPLMLSVNVSPVQLREHSLTAKIRQLAEAGGFPLERITIEITETALLNDLSRAKTIANELKSIGCKLALDDFGTGYSSLAHLQALPFSELKVDRSFVSQMAKTRQSRKIVAAIIGLGHSLGLVTVAEGIETEEQADMLLWLGCEQGQGWLYGRPLPIDQVAAVVAAPPRALSPRMLTPGDGWASSTLEALPTQRLAQLQAIYDGAPVGLCFLDRNFRYVSLNQRLANMNGNSIAAHVGKTVEEMVPKIFPLVQPYLCRVLDGESISEVEIVVLPDSGSEQRKVTLRLSYQPALDEADEVIGISIAVLDISENKEIEEKLHERDDFARNLVERTVQVPWAMDPDGNNLQTSCHWVLATSVTNVKMRNLSWLEALHPDDLEPTIRTMKDALRTGHPIDIVYRVSDLDGGWKWMRSKGSPRYTEAGEIARWYGTVEEIDPSTIERYISEQCAGESGKQSTVLQRVAHG